MKKVLFTALFLLIHVSICLSQRSFDKSPEALKTQLSQSKPDTNQVNLLLKLGEFYLSASDQRSSAVDSALLYAQQSNKQSQLLKYNFGNGNSFLLLSKIYGKKEDNINAKVSAQKAVEIFSKYGPEKKLADSYIESVNSFQSTDPDLTKMIKFAELATGIYHKEKDKEMEATSLQDWGNLLMSHGEMEKGLEKLKQSLVLFQSINYLKLQVVYALIGMNYSISGNYEEALKYGLLSIKTVESLKDTSKETGQFYSFLASTYERIGQLEQMDIYAKKALVIAKKGKDKALTFTLIHNISRRLLKQNKPREVLAYVEDLLKNFPGENTTFENILINNLYLQAYVQLKDYKSAAIYCPKLIAILDKCEQNDPNKRIIYPIICLYFFETAQFDKSLNYLNEYKIFCEKNKLIPYLRNVHLELFRVDSALGNYSSAIEHYKLYKTLNDSLFKETKSKQIAQIQVLYDTEKKDKSILLLTEQDLLQKAKLKQSDLVRNVILGGVVLLIIILSLLYNRYRLKLRTNQKLEAQQKEIYEKNKVLQHLLEEKNWLVKEIHHRVKNNLQTVISLLNSQYVYLQNEEAQSAIQDSHNRILAMSLIHQKLYISDNLSTINMPVYIRELVANLRDCYDTEQRIRFELKIAELELDVSQAVPLGLILNEAITNAIKYAFPNNRNGVISITLLHTVNDHFLLTVADNGIGMPAGFNKEKPGSLGMSLMEGLSKDLDGTFSIENNNGTVLKISFVHDVSTKHLSTFTSEPVPNNS